MRRSASRHLTVIALTAGLWGAARAWLYPLLLPYGAAAEISQAILGVLLLSAARVLTNVRGTSSLIGLAAGVHALLCTATWTSVTAGPLHYSPLLMMLLLGISFDIVYSMLRGRYMPVIGLLCPLMAFALYGLGAWWLWRAPSWTTTADWHKLYRWVFRTGAQAGAGSAIVAFITDALVRSFTDRPYATPRRGRWIMAAILAGLLWALAGTLVVLHHLK